MCTYIHTFNESFTVRRSDHSDVCAGRRRDIHSYIYTAVLALNSAATMRADARALALLAAILLLPMIADARASAVLHVCVRESE